MELTTKPVIILEVKGEHFTYVYHMPIGSPFQEAYNASVQIANEIVKFAENAAEQMKAAQEKIEKNKEETK